MKGTRVGASGQLFDRANVHNLGDYYCVTLEITFLRLVFGLRLNFVYLCQEAHDLCNGYI